MSSGENQELPQPQLRAHQTHPLIFKLKPFYLLSVFVLLLAISFSLTRTHYYKLHNLKSTLSSQSQNGINSNNVDVNSPYCLLWMAPFVSGGGYSSEAWSYILALNDYISKNNPRFRLSIEQHGDLENIEFWEGLPLELRDLAIQLYQTLCRLNETIVVCHSEPGAWYPPLFQTLPCPPTGYGHFKAVIGRTMFETDRVNTEHVKRCNKMDFVWVPTEFHVKTFIESGVEPSKVVKVIQPIDLVFFDPDKCKPLDLSLRGTLILGSKSQNLSLGKQFVFLSIFKWEYRKGWDILLQSYLKEFSGIDGVALYLLTNPYHSDSDFGNKILEFVENSDLEKPDDGWAPVYVIDDHIAQVDLPRLYKAADAFVLPSRGEGWGRPLVEAMAMSLPAIATNWSGPTEFLTTENSYPLPLDDMREVKEGPFIGHLWAEPSSDKLRVLMRNIVNNPEEAKAKGKQARKDMLARFAPDIVAQIVVDQIKKIIDKMFSVL